MAINVQILIVVASMIIATPLSVYAQTGGVTNSKNLEIQQHSYVDGENKAITGIVKNKTPEEITVVDIYALLYDKDNNLIRVESGSLVPVDPLPANQQAKFEIKLFFDDPDFDHYVLIPSGY